jgi:ribosomal protein S18 acetylase RimI-like enzyme
MRVFLSGATAAPPPGVRAVQPTDEQALGPLMYRAYLGTVDYEGETEDQAIAEIRKTFAGGYGPFDANSSRLYEKDASILSATLIIRWQDRPFAAYSITHPEAKNQGLARACMVSAMAALHEAGERELWLAVTLANAPAVALYTSLGFQFESVD